MSDTEELIERAERIEEQIDALEKQKSIKQGELKSARRRLKNELNLGSVKEAKREIKRLKHDLNDLDDELNSAINELDELIADIEIE